MPATKLARSGAQASDPHFTVGHPLQLAPVVRREGREEDRADGADNLDGATREEHAASIGHQLHAVAVEALRLAELGKELRRPSADYRPECDPLDKAGEDVDTAFENDGVGEREDGDDVDEVHHDADRGEDEGPRGDTQDGLMGLADHGRACARYVCEVSAPIVVAAVRGAVLAIEAYNWRARAEVPLRAAVGVALVLDVAVASVQRAPEAWKVRGLQLAFVVFKHLVHELLEHEGESEGGDGGNEGHPGEEDLHDRPDPESTAHGHDLAEARS
eukprot:CAMPEP_0176241696 /NCGR_PEP_ID=MMETSP0121_2-20121125/30027_1 /TAXON_ID=160619 /ORGANISM="Kryptoperidinium foliaceum, Strain CCMP 1326" /LENGTH=273 /DNA_ID=CAMNT_0017581237 /DNA_START=48 /DNA_END=865 /DNA_ORIENTATION=+